MEGGGATSGTPTEPPSADSARLGQCTCSSSSTNNNGSNTNSNNEDAVSGLNPTNETITVTVMPTTGGQFDVKVSSNDSVESLQKLISKRLKVPKERICLLYRDRQLRDGSLQENQLLEGSRVTLLPSVETGLLAQRPEQSVMQALESLNDSQVNDFLSGKAPLNLTMRLGDHMMLIQLQLSTVAPHSSSRKSNANKHAATPNPPPSPAPSLSTPRGSTSPSSSSTSCTSSPLDWSSCCSCDGNNTSSTSTPTATPTLNQPFSRPLLDAKALAEASRNLTHTLKQLSAEDTRGGRRRQGAIIESMHHHGKGVYSGTFSGTLNPALQDRHGRPRRDISTVIHILNDLLCATPHVASRSNAQASQHSQRTHHTTAADKNTHTMQKDGNNTEVRWDEENAATRGKVEHLKYIMEQRRNRRRARREARSSPYTQWSAASTATPTLPQQSSESQANPNEQSELLNPSEPVVA